MKEETKYFIEKYIDLIQNQEFEKLYRHAKMLTPDLWIQDLTLTLQSANINPLEHMTYVPEQYLLKSAESIAPTILLPNHIYYIYDRAFEETDLKFIVIPEGVQGIETRAFAWCFELETVYLPSTLDELRAMIFTGCKNLKEIHYNGTLAKWENVDKDRNWCSMNKEFLRQVKVICKDGETCAG